jgi:Tfp pilus assembly protein PilO
MTRNPIAAIIVILIALGIFFLYVSPTYYGAVAADAAQIAGYDSALAAAATYQTKVAQLTAQRDAIPAAELARLEQYLPGGVDNVQIILDLDALAARSGLQLANFGTTDSSLGTGSGTAAPAPVTGPSMGGIQSQSKTSSAIDSIDLTVSATGTYAALQTFLAGVEKSLRLIDLRSLTVKQSDTGVYTYQMTLRLYWLK